MDGYRVKLKYNDYVHIHKVLSQISSPNLIIQSIAEEKYDDLLAKIPAVYHKEVKHMAGIIINYINQTEQAVFAYYKQAPKEDKKSFMLYVSEHVPMEYQGYCRVYFGLFQKNGWI